VLHALQMRAVVYRVIAADLCQHDLHLIIVTVFLILRAATTVKKHLTSLTSQYCCRTSEQTSSTQWVWSTWPKCSDVIG
jgi:hypothetical protein